MGVYPGSWLCNNSDMCRSGLLTSANGLPFGLMYLLVMAAKIVVGKKRRLVSTLGRVVV